MKAGQLAFGPRTPLAGLAALLLLWSGTAFGSERGRADVCRMTAYVDAGAPVALMEAPTEGGTPLARVQDRQYLCVLSSRPEVEGWV